ncbi:MFS transporter [Helicobacter sp. 11S03491-1]|uniref:MFS transporter n=1 Tax=Helicobacter sp. 11S03491-1 TaxID=1476196 RepID=UPI000BA5E20E|nr:MFS transporter [Helicobacter sp. 11S03491-1]PAF41605.1 MFS transporter [Helicobacter sp. 11S03491-1]
MKNLSLGKTLNKQHIKTLSLSSLGGTLEFYDFVIFVFFATVISQLFFPADIHPFWSTFNTYATFAAGYFIRPLGGIIMAHFGDKNGRKNMFMLSILLMVIPTFLIGILPTYEDIGYGAILLLVVMRILQGIAIGGELPGAWVFISEHVPKRRLGFSLGILTASITGGILLGSIASLIIHFIYNEVEISRYAWRIPFILGGIFGIISIFLRRYLEETPVFKEIKAQNALLKLPLKKVFTDFKKNIVISMTMTWILTGCIVILVLLMPNFMKKVLDASSIEITLIQMVVIFALGVGCVVTGFLRDKFGTIRILGIFSLGFGITSLMFFYTLYHGVLLQWIVFWYILAGIFAGVVNFTPLIMVSVFPANIRFSGLSFSYNLAYAIFGGLAPILVVSLNAYEPMWVGYYLLFLGLLGFGVSVYLRSQDLD